MMTEEDIEKQMKLSQDARALHDSMIISLIQIYDLQQDEYLCIGHQENLGFEIYKNRFVMLDKVKVNVN